MGKEIDWNAPAIPPQEGKRYVMRNGKITAPVFSRDNGRIYDTVDLKSWLSSGYYHEEGRSHNDIIAEYVPTKPIPQVGEWWITRDGLAYYKITERGEKFVKSADTFQWLEDGLLFRDSEHPRDLVRRVELREIDGDR